MRQFTEVDKMAFQIQILDITYPADSSFTGSPGSGTNQFLFVTQNNDGSVGISDATDHPIGVVQDNPTEGLECTVMVAGVTKVVAGSGGVAIDDFVGPSSGGTAVRRVDGTDVGYYINGQVIDAAAEGCLATIMLSAPRPVAKAMS
jgi:hypothetical protein